MKRGVFLVSILVWVSVLGATENSKKATVFAHYSWWFTEGEQPQNASWPPDEFLTRLFYPFPRYPLLKDEGSPTFGTNHGFGGYDAAAAGNVMQHIAWAKEYGIDVFALLWDGPTSIFTPNIEAFRKLGGKMPWIIFYDPNIRFGRLGICRVRFPGSSVAPCSYDFDMKVRVNGKVETLGQVMVNDFKYLKQRGWIDDPYYYRVDGRPVIWVYQVGAFSDESGTNPAAKKWTDYLTEIRKWYWQNYRTELFIVGNLIGPRRAYGPNSDPYITQFDGVSGWSPYGGDCARDPSCDCCRPGAVADAVAPIVATWAAAVPTKKVTRVSAGQSSVEFVPFLMPQYDDQWNRGPGNPRMIARSKADFGHMAEVLGRDMLRGRNWVFLSTFNAWPEGTTMEPTCNWKENNCAPDYSHDRGYYGFDFLEVIRGVFGTN